MKNWKIKVLSTALAMSVLVPTASFAADTADNADAQNTKPFAHHQKFDQEKHQQMQDQLLDCVTKYTPEDLVQWKATLNEQEQLMTELREKQPADQQGPQVSEEVKEKVKAIHEDLKSGNITEEQATEQLKELGIEKPARPDRTDKPEISEEDKEKLDAVREQVEAGELTPEQAKEEMGKLDFKAEGPKKFDENNLQMQFGEAVKANDEAKIKELLSQMLQQLQERNQQMAERLADINE